MKIAVLLSGGVDSSVALRQLVDEGRHDITAFYLKIWLEDDLAFLGDCPWEEDLSYARAVCEELNVPLRIIPLQTEYWERVVSHTVGELKRGRTPSPDILCNQRVKFGAFCDAVDESFDKIATGHYAIVNERDGLHWLSKGNDPVKDQTYFLSHLSQAQLSRCLFPVGQFPKKEVRRLAQAYKLPNQDRRDSQGICFLGKIKYNEFVRCHLGVQKGEIRVLETDEVIGEHEGFWFHTIGQRKGLGLGGGPWFVVSKNPETNTVYVSHAEVASDHARDRFTVSGLNWLSAPPVSQSLTVKVRHGERTTPCQIETLGLDKLAVVMSEPDKGLAPGQYAVFYDGELCLGGGVID